MIVRLVGLALRVLARLRPGEAGLALERRRWRLDLGYFAAQSRAGELFPYPVARRFAGTLSWQF